MSCRAHSREEHVALQYEMLQAVDESSLLCLCGHSYARPGLSLSYFKRLFICAGLVNRFSDG